MTARLANPASAESWRRTWYGLASWKERRRHQLNARTTPQTIEALYAIADRQGWLVGETLEHALAALQRELAGQGA
jgi:hypothetical protein